MADALTAQGPITVEWDHAQVLTISIIRLAKLKFQKQLLHHALFLAVHYQRLPEAISIL